MGGGVSIGGRTSALLLAGAVALAFADSSIVMLGLPEMYGELNASIPGVSLVITGYNAVVAVVALALVPVVRRVRPAPLLIGGLAVFLVSSLACGLVHDLPSLVALRSTQGLGAALLLSASLPVMAHLAGSPAQGRAWWGLAGTLGAVLGPAVGGVLTELFDWRAIFIAQAPVAAVALLAVATPTVWRLAAPQGRAGRIPLWSNLGLVFAFGALVGALFLAVLMIVTVWGFGPLYGALVVSVLPLAAVLVHPLSSRAGPGWGPAAGSLLLAAGLVALALLPAVSAWWAAAALAVCGAGFGLLVPPLTAASVSADRDLGANSAASVGARHVGLVLVLVIVAPLLAVDLDTGGDRATYNATQVILDAPLDLQQKIPVALALGQEFDRTPRGQVPDVAKPFDEIGAADDGGVRAVRDDLLDSIQAALTRSFRSAYLVSALFALLALIPVAVAWRRAGVATAPRRGPPGRPVIVLGGLLAAGALLIGAEAASGGADLGRSTTADPCTTTTDRPRDGFDATLQGIVLDGLAGAACDLGVTREQLVLSFGAPSVAGTALDWDPATVEKAVRSGLVRSIDEAEERGSLNGVVARLLRAVAERAPIEDLIRGAGDIRNLGGIDLGGIDLGGLIPGIG